MTPKEKAQELVNKFDGYKHYAEFAVDEMLIHVDMVDDNAAINYWKQVKQEIELL